MKKGDFVWLGVIGLVIFYIVSPWTNELFLRQTSSHPYIGGFIKFGILATMGELVSIRIKKGEWIKPKGLKWKTLIWALIGVLITLMFSLYSRGVIGSIEAGYLPGKGSSLAFAFFTAAIMNLSFGPVFMGLHKISDTYIDLIFVEKVKKPTLDLVLKTADWNSFVKFTLIKTIPLFWIPVHTATFMMPSEYRIVAAAMLSIALGIILSTAKK